MANILEIRHLSFNYNNTTVFDDLNLAVEEGKFISIAGNNNSGKTTLIKLICGILPSRDSIRIGYSYIDNHRFSDHSKELGVVFGNNFYQFLFEDVYKEMAFPLENLNIAAKEIEKTILKLAKTFGITKLLDKKIVDLTNAEKQELLLVISLLHQPKILLLDNPFSMMDKTTKNRIYKALREYQQETNLTVILTTTNLEDTITTDYLYILNKGNFVVEGEPLVVMKEDRLLNRLGFTIPFMVDLSLKLEFYELVDGIETDLERMVNTLWK